MLALACCAALALAAQTTYTIDPATAQVGWVGRKVTGQHHGTVNLRSGTIQWGANGLGHAEVTMDMTSIADLDLDPEDRDMLVGQLKSTDFFDTRNFPEATFKATQVEKIAGAAAGAPNYKVTGDLTVKGITWPVVFNVLALQAEHGIHATGRILFDRTKYGIKYRSGSFFDALGDRMIDDQVELNFDLMAR